MSAVLASIPSPSRGTIDLGPLVIHMYGLMLLAGIVACIWVTGRRWVAQGGDWDLIFRVAVWGVGFGVLGARLYHDATSWSEVPDHWWGLFAVWEGGLGIWGGILFGALAGAVIVRRAGQSVTLMMDCAAPGLLVAQAIGRIGNWWNQELYGKPTDLPWGLEIDSEHRPVNYFDSPTFHPTFLYEAIYNLLGAVLLIWIGRKFRIRPPGLFALYAAFYSFGRFFEELLRIDPAHEFAGLRLNAWVSIVVFVGAMVFFVWWQFLRGRPSGDTGTRTRRRRKKPDGPRRPTMTIPKSRVR